MRLVAAVVVAVAVGEPAWAPVVWPMLVLPVLGDDLVVRGEDTGDRLLLVNVPERLGPLAMVEETILDSDMVVVVATVVVVVVVVLSQDGW